jgi:phosphohistidine swiveling domain-containing protein
MRAPYIRWFQEIDQKSVHLVGGKGANLGEMVRAGMPVPPGFCVTARAYFDFLTSTGLMHSIQDLVGGAGRYRSGDIDALSSEIRNMIRSATVPDEIGQGLIASYRELGSRLGFDEGASVPVAVRSSATAEDLPEASFAGQQDTYLNILGESEVLLRVRECWASLWTPRAMDYRQKQGYEHLKVNAAVIVQSMLSPDISGVLFTANPVSGDFTEAVLNASWGLGEAIVSGLVSPDTYIIRKADGLILSRLVGTKEIVIVNDGEGGTRQMPVPEARRRSFALTDLQVAEVVDIGRRIEAHYGHPHDVEWAYVDDACYVLQTRPITTLPAFQEAKPAPEYNRTMFVELFPEPLCPLFLSAMQHLIGEMLDFVLRTWGFSPPDGIAPVGVFYNQPYFNRQYIEAAIAPLPERVRLRLIGQIMNPFGHQARGLKGGVSLAYVRFLLHMLRVMYRFPDRINHVLREYRAEIAAVQVLPVDTASDEELVSRITEKVFGAGSMLLGYDFLLIAVTGISYQLMGSILGRYLGEETELLRARLISGLDGNLTMETNMRLWDLAQRAGEDPGVASLLIRTDPSEVKAQLEETYPGSKFVSELESFLRDYGHREMRMDILFPTWVDDPTPVIGFIRGYLEADEAQNPHTRHAALAVDRQSALEEVQAALCSSLTGRWIVFPLFKRVLSYSQALTRERDTMHFELTRMFPLFRRYLLELGKRWKAGGWIKSGEDIFFLHYTELEQMCREPEMMDALVCSRRAEYEAAKSTPWPDVIIGEREIFLDGGESVPASGEVLRGIAGSPGRVSGVARLIRSPDDFGNLGDGEILVAPFTTPVWTPLFAIAAGIITETGGILSHGAIVAREYGIPAVMSVVNATSRLNDGDRIEVDGDQGTVRLV